MNQDVVGRRLQRLRRRRGWSQQQVIAELRRVAGDDGVVLPNRGSLRVTLSRWENGHATPRPEYREWLAAIYGVSPRALSAPSPRTCLVTAGRWLTDRLLTARRVRWPG